MRKFGPSGHPADYLALLVLGTALKDAFQVGAKFRELGDDQLAAEGLRHQDDVLSDQPAENFFQIIFITSVPEPVARRRFLKRVQVENLQVANLIWINLCTSSLELAKFSA
jgi:hypothetical protein